VWKEIIKMEMAGLGGQCRPQLFIASVPLSLVEDLY
jgi:hypothetical protein